MGTQKSQENGQGTKTYSEKQTVSTKQKNKIQKGKKNLRSHEYASADLFLLVTFKLKKDPSPPFKLNFAQ